MLLLLNATERFFDGVRGWVLKMNRLPNTFEHHETKLVAAGLLVSMHQSEHIVPRTVVPRRGQAQRFQQRTMVVHKILIDVSQKMRQFGRIHAADRNRVAMTPTEMLKLFDGMAERMPIVQEFSQSRLADTW